MRSALNDRSNWILPRYIPPCLLPGRLFVIGGSMLLSSLRLDFLSSILLVLQSINALSVRCIIAVELT